MKERTPKIQIAWPRLLRNMSVSRRDHDSYWFKIFCFIVCLLTIIIPALLVVTSLPTIINGEISGEYEYQILDYGFYVEITNYYGSSEDLVIPSYIDGYVVYSIGQMAFSDCSFLKSVTMPNTLQYIGNGAFKNCTSLSSVTIDYGVFSIGAAAFSNCVSLTSISLPESVAYINSGAFSGCTNLVSVIIPDIVVEIRDQTFLNCRNLSTLIIPDGISSIGWMSFSNCTNLTAIYFEGNAPSCKDDWIINHNPNLIVYFYYGANGFTMPSWQGIHSQVLYRAPYPPQDLMTNKGDGQVMLSWKAPSNADDSITNYRVYRGTTFRNLTLLATISATLNYTDSGLKNGQTYFYAVTAVNPGGESRPSVEVAATPSSSESDDNRWLVGALFLGIGLILAIAVTIRYLQRKS
jgi:hypothetical protein